MTDCWTTRDTVRRPESFEEFVVATGDRMLRTAVLLTGERHAAEDLVQCAYAQAFSRWRLVSRADHPAAYTRMILTRLFLSDRRRKRVRELPLLDGADAAAADRRPVPAAVPARRARRPCRRWTGRCWCCATSTTCRSPRSPTRPACPSPPAGPAPRARSPGCAPTSPTWPTRPERPRT